MDPGVRVDGVLTMSVSMSPTKYPDSARVAAYTDAVVDSLKRISIAGAGAPGVCAHARGVITINALSNSRAPVHVID